MSGVRVPWGFSEAPKPGDAVVENLPSPEGRALGVELARLTDLEEARQRVVFPRMHPRCDDCALRAGTRPNGCAETLMDVVKCVVEGVPFYCHKGGSGGSPRHLCAGYAILLMSGIEEVAAKL